MEQDRKPREETTHLFVNVTGFWILIFVSHNFSEFMYKLWQDFVLALVFSVYKYYDVIYKYW